MNFTTSTKNNTPRTYPKQRAKTNDLPTVRLEQRPAGNWVTYLNGGSPFPSTSAEVALNETIIELEMQLEALLCSSASIKK